MSHKPKPGKFHPKSKGLPEHKGLPGGRVFDVQRPGRAAASATSKPVIVGHKPQVHDPFVLAERVAGGAAGAHPRAAGSGDRAAVDAERTGAVVATGAAQVPAVPAPQGSGESALDSAEPSPLAAAEGVAPVTQSVASAGSQPASQDAASAGGRQASLQGATSASGNPPLEPTPPTAGQSPPVPVNPSLAQQLDQSDPSQPAHVRPLPKEAFAALAREPARPAFPTPTDATNGIVVSHHLAHRKKKRLLIIIALTLILAALILNFLLDTDAVGLRGVPRTDLFF